MRQIHLTKKEKDLAKAFEIIIPDDYAPNFNLAPTQNGLVITADEPEIAQKYAFWIGTLLGCRYQVEHKYT